MVPWNDFLIPCANMGNEADIPLLFESEWEWLKQLCELAGEDCCSEVNHSFQHVTLILRYTHFSKLSVTLIIDIAVISSD